MNFKSLEELYSYLENVAIPEALSTTVAEGGIATMQDHVNTDVYEAYTPNQYERTLELLNSCEANLISNDTLELKNTRHEGSKDIVEIIESGIGYYDSMVDELIGARPFIMGTYEELKAGKAAALMQLGLEKKLGKGIITVK